MRERERKTCLIAELSATVKSGCLSRGDGICKRDPLRMIVEQMRDGISWAVLNEGYILRFALSESDGDRNRTGWREHEKREHENRADLCESKWIFPGYVMSRPAMIRLVTKALPMNNDTCPSFSPAEDYQMGKCAYLGHSKFSRDGVKSLTSASFHQSC